MVAAYYPPDGVDPQGWSRRIELEYGGEDSPFLSAVTERVTEGGRQRVHRQTYVVTPGIELPLEQFRLPYYGIPDEMLMADGGRDASTNWPLWLTPIIVAGCGGYYLRRKV